MLHKGYPLQTLYDIRARLKKKAEDDFIDSQVRLKKESCDLRTLQQKLQFQREEREKKECEFLNKIASKEATIGDMQLQKLHTDILKKKEKETLDLIEEQKIKVQKATQQVEQNRREMNKRASEFEIVFKLKDKWIKKAVLAYEKKEEERFEEIATFNHQMREG